MMIGFDPLTIAIFATTAAALFWLDLYSHRSHKPVSLGNATAWTIFYILAALAFAGWLALAHGGETASLFLAGYVLEKALAFDNLMVFAAIFAYFQIPDAYQHRVLHWGILGAIVFRLIFVAIGAGSLTLFGPWVELAFAAIVGWTAYAMWRASDDDAPENYDKKFFIRWARRALPFSDNPNTSRFFLREFIAMGNGTTRPIATPLLLALIAIEISDVLFAFDSVPAVIAVTRDPVLIYAAMIFAILGLRSLYFVLAALTRFLVHLEKAVIAVLVFISAKLGAAGIGTLTTGHPFHIDPMLSLGVVLGLLTLGVIASLVFPEQESA